MDWDQCAPLPPGKKAGSSGSGWRDGVVVACWRDGSFRVRVHGPAFEFVSSFDEKCDYKLEPKSITHIDFASPRSQQGRKLQNKAWRYPPAPRRPKAGARRVNQGAERGGAISRNAAVAGRVSRQGSTVRNASDEQADSSNESSEESEEESEDADMCRCPEMGERIEIIVGHGSSGRGGKRKVAEWKTAEVSRVFRGGAFEARLLEGSVEAKEGKSKYRVADIRSTWRWEHS